jgi:3-hydroxyisobutyrate dehydrogenase-like beta-hydroxyacid dehydrogenase
MDHRHGNGPPLAFIGQGIIGGAVAGRFADAGRDITVYDVNPAAVAAVVRRGAKAGSSARDVGDRAEVVLVLPAGT